MTVTAKRDAPFSRFLSVAAAGFSPARPLPRAKNGGFWDELTQAFRKSGRSARDF